MKDAPWPTFAAASAPELQLAATAHLAQGAKLLLLFFDHEGDRVSVLLDGDASRRAFADGPVDPRRVAACGALLDALPEKARHLASVGCVLLCAELVAQNARRLGTTTFALAVVPEHDERPRLVFEGEGQAPGIFDEQGRLRLRSVEEELEATVADGAALAAVLSRVQEVDAMAFLAKASQFFTDVAKSGEPKADQRSVRALLDALVAQRDRLGLDAWGESLEEVLANAVVCVSRDPEGFELARQLVPEEVTVPLLAYNLACVCALQARERELVFHWVRVALQLGADPEKLRADPDFAALQGDAELERMFSSPSPEAATRRLGEAAEELNFEAAKASVDEGADVNGQHGGDPVLVAALRANPRRKTSVQVAIVRLLLERGARLSPSAWPWYRLVGAPELLELVLDHGVPIAPKLVLEAVEKANLACLERLVARGLEVGKLEAPPLLSACRHHTSKDTLVWLLARGVDVHARSERQNPALLDAASAGNTLIAEALLDNGAELQVRDGRGGSVISHALFNDNAGFIEWVVKRGADLKAVDADGRGLLQQAVSQGSSKSLPVLLALGAPVDVADSSGQTALHCAAAENRLEAVEQLLAAGANREARDGSGKRPGDLARGAVAQRLTSS
ncbi:MAG: ankyrin repeat domain-containing protein [Myxococcaceae bacterium]|nr:ankyrin repeat domain-containing protein [Myxococcaceae bacterium]